MDEQPVRLALLRKAFQSDWEGAAPTAPSSSNRCAGQLRQDGRTLAIHLPALPLFMHEGSPRHVSHAVGTPSPVAPESLLILMEADFASTQEEGQQQH